LFAVWTLAAVAAVSLNYEEAVRAAAAGCNSAADLAERIAGRVVCSFA
jgi:hypothetical protein